MDNAPHRQHVGVGSSLTAHGVHTPTMSKRRTPVTDDEDDTGTGHIPDAEPAAEVFIRPDRIVFISTSRHSGSYHLAPDCDTLGRAKGVRAIDMGEVWTEAIPLCSDCLWREKMRQKAVGQWPPANPGGDDHQYYADDEPVVVGNEYDQDAIVPGDTVGRGPKRFGFDHYGE